MDFKEGYKKTEVGVIPIDWEMKELNDISRITRLAGAEYSDLWEVDSNGEIIALRGFNIGSNKIILNDIERISKSLSDRLNRSKLYKNDIVFPCVGTIGKAAVIYEDNKYHINQNIAKITPNDSIDSLYLSYFLISERVKKQILKYNTSSSQPNVLVGNLRKFKIIKPPLKEQEKIADILSTVDSQIDDTVMLIDKCKVLKKGLMQRLLTKGIGHKEFKKTDVGEIPVEWEVKKLEDLAKIRRGASPRPIKDPKWFSEDKEIGWIRISDVTSSSKYLHSTSQYLSDEGKNKSRPVKENDLIMSICATVGKPIIMKMDTCIHDGFVLLDEIDDDKYDKELLYYVLQRYEECFKSMGQTGTQANLNTELVGGLQVAIPNITEQKRIAEALFTIDKEIKQFIIKKDKLDEVKKGLMQQLLTGKIRTII